MNASARHRVPSDVPFLACMVTLGGSYLLLIVAMLAADLTFTSPAVLLEALITWLAHSSLAMVLLIVSLRVRPRGLIPEPRFAYSDKPGQPAAN